MQSLGRSSGSDGLIRLRCFTGIKETDECKWAIAYARLLLLCTSGNRAAIRKGPMDVAGCGFLH